MYFKDAIGDFKGTVLHREKEIEDLNEKMVYINALPIENIRGLDFHFDSSGYYIIWPNSIYYKLRSWNSTSTSSKYLCPSGHTKPLMVLPADKLTRDLVIVEGEINALSLKTVRPHFDIVCPGGVGNFTDTTVISQLSNFHYYDNIIICVDSDAAGLHGALKLKKLLYEADTTAIVVINLMEKDFNQLLVEYGKQFKEAVKKEFDNLGLPTWVQIDK